MPIPLTPDERLHPGLLWKNLRETASIQFDEALRAWLVLDHELVRHVFADPEAFSSNLGYERAFHMVADFPPFLLGMDPPRHGQLRQLVARAFSPSAMTRLEPLIRQIANDLIDQVVAAGTMRLIADFAAPLPILVIATMLGIPIADHARFKLWSDNTNIGVVATMTTGQSIPECDRSIGELYQYLMAIVEDRMKTPRQDVTSLLTTAEIDGVRLTKSEIAAFVLLLLVAGNETTMMTLGSAFFLLLSHPQQLARLRAEPALIPSAIEEVWRLAPPVVATPRLITRDVELGGQQLYAGQMIFAAEISANRDPKVFADPERFDITRTANAHVAFGHGIHFCLGAPLARLEARIAVEVLLARLPDLQRADDAPIEPLDSVFNFGIKELALRFQPGKPHQPRGAIT